MKRHYSLIFVFVCFLFFANDEVQVQAKTESGLLCELKNQKVNESSGICISLRKQGFYWTHNDSGDVPNLYAFDEQGNDWGTYTLSGAKAIDWEDIASTTIQGVKYIYVGDIGDNSRKREDIKIYRLQEPEIRKGTHTLRKFDTFILKYPDQSHDAETLLVLPNGDIQIVTKSMDGKSFIFEAKSPQPSRIHTMQRAGEITFEGAGIMGGFATGGEVDATNRRVVMRTYTHAYIWQVDDFSNWHKKAPLQIELSKEKQGEAICFDHTGKRLITTSEGVPCRVSYVVISK